jgi:hypothetical protein
MTLWNMCSLKLHFRPVSHHWPADPKVKAHSCSCITACAYATLHQQGPCLHTYKDTELRFVKLHEQCHGTTFVHACSNIFSCVANSEACFHCKYTDCQQGYRGGAAQSSPLSDYQLIINIVYQEEPNDHEWLYWHRICSTFWKILQHIYSNGLLEIQILARFRSQTSCTCLSLEWSLKKI